MLESIAENTMVLLSGSEELSKRTDYVFLYVALVSALVGMLIVALDRLAVYATDRPPLLKLKYGTSTLRMMLIWGLGAGIGGLVGSIAGILQPTALACVTAGVAWPTILPQIIKPTAEDEQTVSDDDQEGDD